MHDPNASQNQPLRLCILFGSASSQRKEGTLFVHSLAVLSCFLRSRLNSAAIGPTNGSSGLGSHNKAKIYPSQIEYKVSHTLSNTFPMVNAGDLDMLI